MKKKIHRLGRFRFVYLYPSGIKDCVHFGQNKRTGYWILEFFGLRVWYIP